MSSDPLGTADRPRAVDSDFRWGPHVVRLLRTTNEPQRLRYRAASFVGLVMLNLDAIDAPDIEGGVGQPTSQLLGVAPADVSDYEASPPCSHSSFDAIMNRVRSSSLTGSNGTHANHGRRWSRLTSIAVRRAATSSGRHRRRCKRSVTISSGRRPRDQIAIAAPPAAVPSGQPPGGRYVGVAAAAASRSSAVSSGVREIFTAPEALTINENDVALASSGKSQIPYTSVSPNA